MDIILCGSGTGVPSIRRNPCSILVKSKDKNILFDSGPGTLKTLLKAGVNYLNLDVVFYTHLHLDHISGLSALLFAAKIPPDIRKKPLAIYGPKGLKEYYKKLLDLYQDTLLTDAYKLEIKEIEGESINIADLEISTKMLRHHGRNLGYRIKTLQGNVMVYSGDTDLCEELLELSKNSDLLFLECSFPDGLKMKNHLSPKDIKEIATLSNAKKIVLT
ncbi:MAG: ribonuclease Z, partial [Candidatus Omnitrophota bacterium]